MNPVDNRAFISACITTVAELDMHLKAAEQSRNQLVALLHQHLLSTAKAQPATQSPAEPVQQGFFMRWILCC